jgi:hypothetical protein
MGTLMTLVIAAGNDEYMLQVSDRRLSAGYPPTPTDEESCKGGLICCDNARLIFGFAGIAEIGGFKVRRWILDTLMSAGSPSFDAYGIVTRFRERADHDFSSLPQFVSLAPSQRRLTVIFSGYIFNYVPPLAVYAIMSNHVDFQTGSESEEAWPSFSINYWNEKRPGREKLSMVQ